MNEKIVMRIMAVVFVVTVVCLVMVSYLSPKDMLNERDEPLGFIGEYRIEGQTKWHTWEDGALEDFKEKRVVTFRGRFSKALEKNQVLCMRISNIRVRIFAGGEEIYSVGMEEELPDFSKSPGNGWDTVTLRQDITAGEEVVIQIYYPYMTQAGEYIQRFFRELRIGNGSMHLLLVVQDGFANMVLSLLIIFFGGVLLLAAGWFRNREKQAFSLLTLGGMGMAIGIWLMLDFNSITVLYPNYIVCNLMDVVGKQYAFGFGYAFCAMNFTGRSKRLLLWLSAISFFRVILTFFVQMTGIADYYEYEYIAGNIGVVLFIIVLVTVCYSGIKHVGRNILESNLPFFILGAGMGMNYTAYHMGVIHPKPLFWFRISVLIFFSIEIIRMYRMLQRWEVERRVHAARGEFLTRMSHDIRTPLNAVLGYTGLAYDHSGEEERVREYLEKASTSGNYLLSLINNMLDVAKSEHQGVTLHNEPCGLDEIMQRALANILPQAEKKQQNLIVHREEVTHQNYVADAFRINQILVNVLSNAVKYTDFGGTILFTVKELTASKETLRIQFIVADNGMGMPREFLVHVFENYARSESAQKSDIPGTGLGLAITKGLVDAMGGTIQVESEVGKGSTFYINLKLALDLQVAETPVAEYDFEGKRFLLVEDNAFNAEILTELVTEQGAVVEHAQNGEEAVACFADRPAYYYNAIFMDVQMPGMNGYEATTVIRQMMRGDAREIGIIAMSANAFDEDRTAAFEAGMNAHVPKPIDMDRLTGALNKLERERMSYDSEGML